MNKQEVLLIEDDPYIVRTIKPALVKNGYEVTVMDSQVSIVDTLGEKEYDLVMDLNDGMGFLKNDAKKGDVKKYMVLSGYGDIMAALDALRYGYRNEWIRAVERGDTSRNGVSAGKPDLLWKIYSSDVILPVCSVCNRYRDDSGTRPGMGVWRPMDTRLKASSRISHTYCPRCAEEVRRLYKVG